MGSSASKVGRAAAGNVARKYPSRASPSTQAPPSQPANVAPTSQFDRAQHPPPQTGFDREEGKNLNASDPTYASNLYQLGIVDPNPSFSHSSDPPRIQSSPTAHNPDFYSPPTQNPSSNHPFPDAYSLNPASNPALLILQARQKLQDEADREFEGVGRRGFEGRQFVDIYQLREALVLRNRGMQEGEIEKELGLRKGVVSRLGAMGIVDTI